MTHRGEAGRAGRLRSGYVSVCADCQKRSYTRRADAKAKARQLGGGVRAYSCPAGNGIYHVGHLPHSVIEGEATRDEVFERRDAKQARRALRGDE